MGNSQIRFTDTFDVFRLSKGLRMMNEKVPTF